MKPIEPGDLCMVVNTEGHGNFVTAIMFIGESYLDTKGFVNDLWKVDVRNPTAPLSEGNDGYGIRAVNLQPISGEDFSHEVENENEKELVK